MRVVDTIVKCAKVPSFSTFEERLHPLLNTILNEIENYYHSKAVLKEALEK